MPRAAKPAARPRPAARRPAADPVVPRLFVSSSHLVSARSQELSEFEFGLILASNAFMRWVVRCMAAAGLKDLAPLEVLLLHHVNHRAREKKLADICFMINIEDTHVVAYALKKLVRARPAQDRAARQGGAVLDDGHRPGLHHPLSRGARSLPRRGAVLRRQGQCQARRAGGVSALPVRHVRPGGACRDIALSAIVQDRFLGVLMLATRFPRPPGDIGNPLSFDHRVRYTVVEAATPQRVVREHAHGLLPAFRAAAQALARDGAAALTTSCGFLALHQRELAAAVDVPFATSSLLQLPTLQAIHGSGAVGVLTIDAASLALPTWPRSAPPPRRQSRALRLDAEFARCILEDSPSMDLDQARNDVVAAAVRLRERVPSLRAIVLECTNMPPYAEAVATATGCAVYDILGLCRQLWQATNRTGGGDWQDTTRRA